MMRTVSGRPVRCVARRLVGEPRPVVLPPSDARTRAIQAVMQLFVDDDLASGLAAQERRFCDVCQSERPLPGFIRYGDRTACNACATAFELARIRREAVTIEEY